MPQKPDRELEPPREAKEVYERWLKYLDDEITRHTKPVLREQIVLNNLHQMLLGSPKGGRLNFNLNTELPYNVLQLSLDPKNITLDGEYDGAIDMEQYAPRKPLIYFWHMFDRSSIGLNHWLGFRFRAMLGRHIFRHMGQNVTFYGDVQIAFGYNVTVEDDCVIHRGAILDDRGEIVLKQGTVLSEFAAVYAGGDSEEGKDGKTEIGPRARLAAYSVVKPGSNLGDGATVGGAEDKGQAGQGGKDRG